MENIYLDLEGLVLFNKYSEAKSIFIKMDKIEQKDFLIRLADKYESMLVYGFILYLLFVREEEYIHDIAIEILQTSLSHIEGAYELVVFHLKRKNSLYKKIENELGLLYVSDVVLLDYKEELNTIDKELLDKNDLAINDIKKRIINKVNDIEIIDDLVKDIEHNIKKADYLSGLEDVVYIKEDVFLAILSRYQICYVKEYKKILRSVVKGAFTQKVVKYLIDKDICIEILLEKNIELELLYYGVEHNFLILQDVLIRLYEDQYKEDFFEMYIKHYSDDVFRKMVEYMDNDLNKKDKMLMITEKMTSNEDIKKYINDILESQKLMYINDDKYIIKKFNENNSMYNKAIAQNINAPNEILDKLMNKNLLLNNECSNTLLLKNTIECVCSKKKT